MAKELWVVESAMNPLILADPDWEIVADYLRSMNLTVTDNEADHKAELALIKGEK